MPLLDPLILDNVVPFDKTLFVLSTIGVITELGVGITNATTQSVDITQMINKFDFS
jgi:hypothetical protein